MRAPALRGLGLLALVGFVACEPTESQVVVGRRYLPERDCLEARTAIDIVEGANPNQQCEDRVCMVGSSPLVEEPAVYVTRQCPPYPPTFDLSESHPDCRGALEALERGDFCTEQGSSNPRDAGPGDEPQPDAAPGEPPSPDAAPEESPPDAAVEPEVPMDAGDDSEAPLDGGADAEALADAADEQ